MNMAAEQVVDTTTDLSEEINEIYESLINEQLTILEKCQYLKMGKDLHLKMYPERAHGGRPKGTILRGESFLGITARILKSSNSEIGKKIYVATNLDEQVQEALKGTPIENNQAALLRLAKLTVKKQKEFIAPPKNDEITVPPTPDVTSEVNRRIRRIDRFVRKELKIIYQLEGSKMQRATKAAAIRQLVSLTTTVFNSQ